MSHICDCGQVYETLAGIEACQMNNHGQPIKPPWKRFQYDRSQEDGLYWLAGKYPDIDEDGSYQGDADFVVLSWLNVYADGEYSFDLVDIDGMPTSAGDDWLITHYMEFKKPAKP